MAPTDDDPVAPADDTRYRPTVTECDQVLHDVWLFLDNEMDTDARAAVQKHLDDCSPCLDEAGIEEKLKKLVHRTCSGERAPDQLRTRLVSALESVRVTAVAGPDGCAVRVEQIQVLRSAPASTANDEADPAADR